MLQQINNMKKKHSNHSRLKFHNDQKQYINSISLFLKKQLWNILLGQLGKFEYVLTIS